MTVYLSETKTQKMKKVLILSLLAVSLSSCFQKEENSRGQKISYDTNPIEKIREYGKAIEADTAFYNHIEDITLPLNMSMEDLKNQDPDFYAECMEISDDKELTKKLKSSSLFRKIARDNNLDLRKVAVIQHLK